MKKIFLILSVLSLLVCNAQDTKVVDYEQYDNLPYVLANIDLKKTVEKALFKNAFFIKAFVISDTKLKNHSVGEILHSIYITTNQDGPYIKGKLYKIVGLINPKILSIEEVKDTIKGKVVLKVRVKLVSGAALKRNIENFIFEL
jgi:hypothetical protein